MSWAGFRPGRDGGFWRREYEQGAVGWVQRGRSGGYHWVLDVPQDGAMRVGGAGAAPSHTLAKRACDRAATRVGQR